MLLFALWLYLVYWAITEPTSSRDKAIAFALVFLWFWLVMWFDVWLTKRIDRSKWNILVLQMQSNVIFPLFAVLIGAILSGLVVRQGSTAG